MKPAGGTGTVSQSGISKQLDAVNGHKLLASIAKSLAKCERQLAEYAAMVIRNQPIGRDGETDPGQLPSTVQTVRRNGADRQPDEAAGHARTSGRGSEYQREILQAIVRQTLLGLTDREYDRLDAEIELMVQSKSRLKEPVNEMADFAITSQVEAMEGQGSAEQAAGEDPTGQSGGTLVGNMVPSVM